MGILGIQNRTENWKTVRIFHSLSPTGRHQLVDLLLVPEEPRPNPGKEVRLELFWRGIRDYMKQKHLKINDLEDNFHELYQQHFNKLRDHLTNFSADEPPHNFEDLQPHNYDGTRKYPTKRNTDKLAENLSNTEIDIVLETSTHLFIGEAKHESQLGTNSNFVLVHQLIRQYVMAKVILDLQGKCRKVTPFLVGDSKKLDSHRNTVQVKFMVAQEWLRLENVLSWDRIRQLDTCL